jgi:hypothetical protein
LKFVERNSAIDIQHFDFVFDDITIKIENVANDNYLNLALLFQQLHRHIKNLESKGIKDISFIRLPVVGAESAELDLPKEVQYGEKYTDCIWCVEYDFGCNKCYYNSCTGELIEE